MLAISVPLAQVHPLVWRYVVDEVIPDQLAGGLIAAILIMIGAQILASGTGAIQEYFLEKAGQSFVRDVRNAIYARVGAQSMAYHHDRRTGDLVTRVISDVDAMESAVLRSLSNLLEEIFTFVIVAAIVIWLQPVVGLCTMIPLAVAFVLFKMFGQRIQGIYKVARKRLGDIGVFVHDRLSGVHLTQAFAQERRERAEFAEVTEAHYSQMMKAIRLRTFFFPGVGLFGFLSNVVMLGLGAWFVWRGEFTLGGLIAYRGYWWRLQSPISTVARLTDTLMRARASAERVMSVLCEPIAIEDPSPAQEWKEGQGAVAFSQVEFGYVPERTILRDVTFQVAAGEFVAIAGTSGAGKSTLLNLIPRFYDVWKGQITVDGVDVRNYSLESLRSRIGFVLQETYLFNTTIAENIAYARPAASRTEVETAARRANAHEFILGLPNAYETTVGERGVKLSGGQKQRISVARAFLADPTVLLLDEPTSSVEPESEEVIHSALLDLSQNRTTLLVTHRVSLLQRARRILYFQHGTVAAEGSHAELLRNCPGYAKSYREWEREDAERVEA